MFSLTVKISATDLPVILDAEERIVLVKNIGSGKPVAWIALQPVQQTALAWDGGYSLFASSSPVKIGGQITMTSTTPATGGCAYPFSAVGFGTGVAQSGLAAQQYRVDNGVPASTSPGLLFGLAQPISVNGNASPPLAALNAETVPAMQSTIQSATDSVTIWLQSGVVAGQMLALPSGQTTTSVSGTLVIPFNGISAQTVLYSSQSGRFEIVP